jgi:magnesium chelatase family protein
LLALCAVFAFLASEAKKQVTEQGLFMVAHIRTVSFEGVRVTEVDVQVTTGPGLPAFIMVGLPDKAVAESKERVRAAIHSLGLSLPAKKIIVNLAPADLAKEGSHFDLPIALGLLVAMDVLTQEQLEAFYVLGEVSLDGKVLPVSGVLPAAVGANASECGIICPQHNGAEALWAGDGISVIAAPSLLALINHLRGDQLLPEPQRSITQQEWRGPDLKDVRGQETAKRALEIAAAGGHNMLMLGPPGSGKSMLASCLPGILPPLEPEEMLEVSMIASVAGKLANGQLSRIRSYRDPHHSSSLAAMVGGGRRAQPGEISLSHCGILFLDELPEFPRAVLESLRQPLETGTVSIARAESHVTYPSNFQLIAAMNPCRCGYLDDPARCCGKAPRCANEYQNKLSGPLLDRIDIYMDVPAVDTLEMLSLAPGEPSANVRARVSLARDVQRKRFLLHAQPFRTNSDIKGEVLFDLVSLDANARAMLEKATEKFRLSMRGYTRILRVARTIADLDGCEAVLTEHIAEAISYRQWNWTSQLESA